MRFFRRKQKPQDELFERLMKEHLGQKRKEARRKQREVVLGFLSHGAWQGVGAGFGVISVIVSTVLAFYVISFTREQDTANFFYLQSSLVSNREFENSAITNIQIRNTGPSTGRDVTIKIQLIDFDKITCETYPSNQRAFISPTQVKSTDTSCVYHFDYFHPNQIFSIAAHAEFYGPSEFDNQKIYQLYYIDIFGTNVRAAGIIE